MNRNMWSQSRFVRVLGLLLLGLAIFSSVWLIAGSGNASSPTRQAESSLAKNVNVINPNSKLPQPGSYELQKVFAVPDFKVLNTKGEAVSLREHTQGKLTLLTFFYERCSDANGCPYALTVFHSVKAKLESLKAADQVRLVNISFDPERDTPMMMAGMEKRMRGEDQHHGDHEHEGHHEMHHSTGKNDGVEWKFFTTNSVNELLPLIDAFGQNVDIAVDQKTGQKTLSYQHVLKVFLIDSQGFVREIYSTPYLDPEVLLNDIQTLTLKPGGFAS
jgi:protein SCO1/2